MKFILNKPKDSVQEKEYQNTLFDLTKYGENISTVDLDDNLIEMEIHLSEQVDIDKFKSYIKQNNLFYSFFRL
ncbi:MAG TPA: hypothetical protein PLD18_03525 [Flavobacterium sp.]|nr:hypothetical protein [Flavobacterium sp.]HRA73275.1 hypothetical protein [Flavobacterium sp.]